MADVGDSKPDRDIDAEIDAESVTPLPNREALSIVDPSLVTRIMPAPNDPTMTTGQGMNESEPEA